MVFAIPNVSPAEPGQISQYLDPRLDMIAAELNRLGIIASQGAIVDGVRQGDLAVSARSFGVVADCDGSTGTDNAAAFANAVTATPEGGTLYIPPGRYYLSAPLVINKAMTITAGAGGLNGGPIGTQLVFAPGVSGIRVVQTGATAPRKWTISGLYIQSKVKDAGADVGIWVNSGRGVITGCTVEGFGSHGIHVIAGVGYGGGNANLTSISDCRVYANRGDGIRIEGSDANACLVQKVDCVSNYGWGINVTGASMTKIIAAHADQRANGSPGAFRDNGNSNDWDWLYSEGGTVFLIDTGSSNGRIAVSAYATPTITAATAAAASSWRIEQDLGARSQVQLRELGTGKKLWRLVPGGYAVGSLDLVQQTDSLCVWTVDSAVTRLLLYASLIPSADAAKSLGSKTARWVNGFFSSYVRVGATTTAARPAAATAGAGAHMFDTTLGKPIWSNGTTWRDATGAAV